jgi:predicted small secreted protein
MTKEKLFALVIALGLAAGATGCNTVKGAGKDVQGAGKAVENTADDVHDDMKK